MFRFAPSAIVAAYFLASITGSASAQPSNACAIIGQNPVFTQERIESVEEVSSSYRKLQCSANWSSHREAMNAGVDVGAVVYGVPIEVGGTFDQTEVNQWKSSNCSDEDRSADSQSISSETYIRYDSVNATAMLSCLQSMFGGQALTCDINQMPTGVVYNAYWRRTAGEQADAAPKVIGFVAGNVTCENVDALAVGKAVPDGGTGVFCALTSAAPIFVLNTDRGVCTATGTAKAEEIVLSGKMVLSAPFTRRGSSVALASDLEIISGPYPINISADQLTIAGNPMIRSFEVANAPIGQPGENAGSVRVQASRVTGDGAVTIFQAGQNGGTGEQGPQGPRGSTGSPGVGRTVTQKEVCNVLSLGGLNPFSKLVCEMTPAGCEGGQNGGPGGRGGQGQVGESGGPGGHAGLVSLVVPPDALDRFNVLVDTDVSGVSRNCGGKVCGGLGGPGGPGGPGGSGGSGGPGAPGTTWCGGTSAGPGGPEGPTGERGPTGPDGDNQIVRR